MIVRDYEAMTVFAISEYRSVFDCEDREVSVMDTRWIDHDKDVLASEDIVQPVPLYGGVPAV